MGYKPYSNTLKQAQYDQNVINVEETIMPNIKLRSMRFQLLKVGIPIINKRSELFDIR